MMESRKGKNLELNFSTHVKGSSQNIFKIPAKWWKNWSDPNSTPEWLSKMYLCNHPFTCSNQEASSILSSLKNRSVLGSTTFRKKQASFIPSLPFKCRISSISSFSTSLYSLIYVVLWIIHIWMSEAGYSIYQSVD